MCKFLYSGGCWETTTKNPREFSEAFLVFAPLAGFAVGFPSFWREPIWSIFLRLLDTNLSLSALLGPSIRPYASTGATQSSILPRSQIIQNLLKAILTLFSSQLLEYRSPVYIMLHCLACRDFI
jgi:hypothetical protein